MRNYVVCWLSLTLLASAGGCPDLVPLDVGILQLNPVAGPQGEPGEQGAQGEPGPQGEQGPAGPAGEDGQGGQGAAGAPGIPGADGEDGVNGQDGADGANGLDGADGAQGPQGEPGPEGPQGEPGTPGITSYAVADAGGLMYVEQDDSVKLDGTGSYLQPGAEYTLDDLSYSWAQIDNSGVTIELIDADMMVANFIAPRPPASRFLAVEFRLTITDPNGFTSFDDVQVRIERVKD